MNTRWKILLSLTALFLLGAACGAVVTARLRPAAGPAVQPVEERWTALSLADCQQKLGLAEEQVEKLKPVFKRTGQKMKLLRLHTVERLHELLGEMDEQLAEDLTPEQRAQLKGLRVRRAPAAAP